MTAPANPRCPRRTKKRTRGSRRTYASTTSAVPSWLSSSTIRISQSISPRANAVCTRSMRVGMFAASFKVGITSANCSGAETVVIGNGSLGRVVRSLDELELKCVGWAEHQVLQGFYLRTGIAGGFWPETRPESPLQMVLGRNCLLLPDRHAESAAALHASQYREADFFLSPRWDHLHSGQILECQVRPAIFMEKIDGVLRFSFAGGFRLGIQNEGQIRRRYHFQDSPRIRPHDPVLKRQCRQLIEDIAIENDHIHIRMPGPIHYLAEPESIQHV